MWRCDLQDSCGTFGVSTSLPLHRAQHGECALLRLSDYPVELGRCLDCPMSKMCIYSAQTAYLEPVAKVLVFALSSWSPWCTLCDFVRATRTTQSTSWSNANQP